MITSSWLDSSNFAFDNGLDDMLHCTVTPLALPFQVKLAQGLALSQVDS